MKTIITDAKNLNLEGYTVQASSDSLLVTAKKTFYVPEKKIVLLDQMNEHESQLLAAITDDRNKKLIV